MWFFGEGVVIMCIGNVSHLSHILVYGYHAKTCRLQLFETATMAFKYFSVWYNKLLICNEKGSV